MMDTDYSGYGGDAPPAPQGALNGAFTAGPGTRQVDPRLLALVGGVDPQTGQPLGAVTAGLVDPTQERFFQEQAQQAKDMRAAAPLSDYASITSDRDRAAYDKMQAIKGAIARLQGQQDGQTVNIPLLAASSAIGQNTIGFAGDMARAGTAGAAALQQQRNTDWEHAMQMGTLGMQGAGVEGDLASQKMKDWMDMNTRAETIGNSAVQGQHYMDYADARRYGADAGANARVQAALAAADASRYRSDTMKAIEDAKEAARTQGLDSQAQSRAAQAENGRQNAITARINAYRQTTEGMLLPYETLRAQAEAEVGPSQFGTGQVNTAGSPKPKEPAPPTGGSKSPLPGQKGSGADINSFFE